MKGAAVPLLPCSVGLATVAAGHPFPLTLPSLVWTRAFTAPSPLLTGCLSVAPLATVEALLDLEPLGVESCIVELRFDYDAFPDHLMLNRLSR